MHRVVPLLQHVVNSTLVSGAVKVKGDVLTGQESTPLLPMLLTGMWLGCGDIWEHAKSLASWTSTDP